MLHKITLESKTTGGTHDFYLDTDDGAYLAEYAQKEADGYGATVYSIDTVHPGEVPEGATIDTKPQG